MSTGTAAGHQAPDRGSLKPKNKENEDASETRTETRYV